MCEEKVLPYSGKIKNVKDPDYIPDPFDNSIKGRIRNTMYGLRQQKKLGQKAAVSAGGIGVGVGGGKLMQDSLKKEEMEHYDWRSTLDEKCWAGYEKKGMKTMFGKRYPNCVKKSKKKK